MFIDNSTIETESCMFTPFPFSLSCSCDTIVFCFFLEFFASPHRHTFPLSLLFCACVCVCFTFYKRMIQNGAIECSPIMSHRLEGEWRTESLRSRSRERMEAFLKRTEMEQIRRRSRSFELLKERESQFSQEHPFRPIINESRLFTQKEQQKQKERSASTSCGAATVEAGVGRNTLENSIAPKSNVFERLSSGDYPASVYTRRRHSRTRSGLHDFRQNDDYSFAPEINRRYDDRLARWSGGVDAFERLYGNALWRIDERKQWEEEKRREEECAREEDLESVRDGTKMFPLSTPPLLRSSAYNHVAPRYLQTPTDRELALQQLRRKHMETFSFRPTISDYLNPNKQKKKEYESRMDRPIAPERSREAPRVLAEDTTATLTTRLRVRAREQLEAERKERRSVEREAMERHRQRTQCLAAKYVSRSKSPKSRPTNGVERHPTASATAAHLLRACHEESFAKKRLNVPLEGEGRTHASFSTAHGCTEDDVYPNSGEVRTPRTISYDRSRGGSSCVSSKNDSLVIDKVAFRPRVHTDSVKEIKRSSSSHNDPITDVPNNEEKHVEHASKRATSGKRSDEQQSSVVVVVSELKQDAETKTARSERTRQRISNPFLVCVRRSNPNTPRSVDGTPHEQRERDRDGMVSGSKTSTSDVEELRGVPVASSTLSVDVLLAIRGTAQNMRVADD